MICFPNAKINLGLQVINKRPDGYHNLSSCFYPIGWYDVLEAVEASAFAIDLTGIRVQGEVGDNLCVKAYRLLQADFDLPPVHIHLHKNLPIGAGLGGGSADGAFALRLFNDLFGLACTPEQLETYAAQLGSDCPFFIRNQPVMVGGRGELFEEFTLDLSAYWIAVVFPALPIATAAAFRNLQLQPPALRLAEVLKEPVETWKDRVINDFETGIFAQYPLLAEVKSQLYGQGAHYASMSGSGSALFGLFPEKPTLSFPPSFATWVGRLTPNPLHAQEGF